MPATLFSWIADDVTFGGVCDKEEGCEDGDFAGEQERGETVGEVVEGEIFVCV